jgi:hypothetical protein
MAAGRLLEPLREKPGKKATFRYDPLNVKLSKTNQEKFFKLTIGAIMGKWSFGNKEDFYANGETA